MIAIGQFKNALRARISGDHHPVIFRRNVVVLLAADENRGRVNLRRVGAAVSVSCSDERERGVLPTSRKFWKEAPRFALRFNELLAAALVEARSRKP